MSHKQQFNIKYITRSQRWYRNFLALCGSFLVAFSAASTFAPVHNSDASQQITVNNELTGHYITITIPDDEVVLNVEASPTGQLASAKTSVNVETNSPTGYKLYLSSSSLDNNLYKDGSSANSASGYFSSIGGDLDNQKALTQNTWGFTMDEVSVPEPAVGSTWAGVPKSDNPITIATAEAQNTATGGTDYEIYYGVNASTALPAGAYSGTVLYTAVSEGVNSFNTMQDFTAAECDKLGTDQAIKLTDARDGKYYRVTKLKDGHCWMTQNLALDGTDASGNVRTLTPSDSNVTTSRKLRENITDETVANDKIQIYSGIAEDTTTETDRHALASDEPYGNLYNFMAATAGVGTASVTGTVAESICPKGWRLPDNTGDFSWANLMGKYNYPTTGSTSDDNYPYIEALQKAPFYIPLAGRYGDTNEQAALLWTREAHGTTAWAYLIGFYASTGQFNPSDNGGKFYGFSVRCVFGGQADEIMQNFTQAMCDSLTESTAIADNRKTMIDSRDGKFYKISKLADGNCWMVQNLALDGMDGLGTVRILTTADSNVTANRTLVQNTTDASDKSTGEMRIWSFNAQIVDGYGSTYGNLYTWNAAVAGTARPLSSDPNKTESGSYTESVCSKGWQLPDSSSGTHSFVGLVGAYDMPTSNINDAAGSGTTYVAQIQQAPLYFPPAQSHRYNDPGSGQYWAREVHTNNYALALRFVSSRGWFQPVFSNSINFGFSVRCVFGEN